MVQKRRNTKSEKAYQLLKESLQTGVFSPGERLTEAKVAKTLRLGRVPVRESMLRLEMEGLLKSRGPYGGKFVEYLEDQKVEDVLYRYETREVIEGYAARLAAKNMTGWQIDQFREHARRVSEVHRAGADRKTRSEASENYHLYLLRNCGNPLLLEIWNTHHLMPVSTRSTALEARILGNIPDPPKHNEKLVMVAEAVASHNPDEAERCMREYIREITDAIRRVSLDPETRESKDAEA